MKKDHLTESTINVTDRRLRLIAKTANLDNPDKVTEYLANKEGKNGYIDSLTSAYERYTRYNEIFWKKPYIKRSSQPPYVPTTEETSILRGRDRKGVKSWGRTPQPFQAIYNYRGKSR